MSTPTPTLTERTSTERTPRYRDRQLAALLKELRAATKPLPKAAHTLERVEGRLVYLLRLLDAWDATHARRADELLRLGRTEAAAQAAALVFDQDTRHALYQRTPLLNDTSAAERIEANAEAEREVLA
jgi:hypothetical protein